MVYVDEEIFLMVNIVIDVEIDHLLMIHHWLTVNMGRMFQYFDFQLHEDILLMYHELLLIYQYDQLNVGIP
jgi:hypothetical protein